MHPNYLLSWVPSLSKRENCRLQSECHSFFNQTTPAAAIRDARTAAGQEQLPVYHFPSMSSPQQHPNADVMKIIIIHVTFVDIIGRWSRDRHASSQQLVDLAQYKTICRYYVVFTRHPMGAPEVSRLDAGSGRQIYYCS